MKLPPGTHFMQGNEACVEAAIHSGLRFFAGYPITPSTEVAEGLALRLPEEGGVFIQMEDELASISAIIGASWTGVKAMTATSGPGFSLMQESIGYASVTETPLVILDVMRGGPSTGLPTLPAQGDVMQARYGSHGDYPIIALAAATVQDMFDLTVRSFNLTEKYRVPVILLTDAEVGHMRGKFVVPERVEVFDRFVREDKVWHDGFAYDESLVPRFPAFGKGGRVHVTGLSHDVAGYPRSEPEVHEDMVCRLREKVDAHVGDICSIETVRPGSRSMIVTYGSPSLAARDVLLQRKDVGLIDLKTIWPFPEALVRNAIAGTVEILTVEMNLGQIHREVQRVACDSGCKDVRLLSKVGGEVPTPSEIDSALRGAA
ncbi:MAG: 2-oxoacid:acceptor oxidoreductase subunit alpha [Methanomassiliicoccales archaeon]|nr:2-oxoacid:acceptor oxidoreductase subunit alpha [Methanomassiliicoccales archaeon]